MKKSSKILSCIILVIFASTTIMVPNSLAQTSKGASIDLIAGDLETISVKSLTRVSVTNPDIADVANVEADKITILGKKPGQTIVFLWDDAGKHSVVVHVASQDMSLTRARIMKILEKAQITGVTVEENVEEGRVILSGSLLKDEKEALEKVLEPFSDDTINLVKEKVEDDLVQIDMQVTELSSTLEKSLGINWAGGASGNPLKLNYDETLPAATGKAKNLFKIGDFNRTTAMIATVNALIEEGKGRVLSRPRLVVVSGKEASFLVGGEIPIKSTTTNSTGGSTTENTTFKQYGVNMTISPTIKENKINVLLKVDVSDVDPASDSRLGNDIAFVTRNAQTELLLEDKQTIVLAGLIRHVEGEKVVGVPFLSKLPLVGGVFRNRKTTVPNSETELVISLTPTILRSKIYAESEVVLPSAKTKQLVEDVEAPFEKRSLKEPVVPVQEKAVEPKAVVAPVIPAPIVQAPAEPSMPYSSMIQQKIAKAISYPYEALQNNWQGTVRLKLHILKDGTLATANVLQSSGHEVFDQDAINTAKIVAPYPAFPAGMSSQEDLIVTVPIVYSQGSLSKVTAAASAKNTATN